MGPPLQQSVTQPVIARYVRLSASPCRLSHAHASGERVHAAGGQRVHAGCRSCVGKRCIVSALRRCVANINQDNRRILRLSSVGSLPLAKNAPTSFFFPDMQIQYRRYSNKDKTRKQQKQKQKNKNKKTTKKNKKQQQKNKLYLLKSIRVHLAAGSKVVKIFTHLHVIIGIT